MSCSDYSIQHEGEPRRRVPRCSPPKLRVGSPLDPSPKPSVAVCQGRRAPDNSYPPFYTACEACDDIPPMMQGQHHRTLNIIMASECGNNWWEMGGGKLGMLIAFRHTSASLYKIKFNLPRPKGTAGQHVTYISNRLCLFCFQNSIYLLLL